MFILTIITICKNNKNDLERTLSTLSNKPQDIQHIIIDGSNDSIIKDYLNKTQYPCEYYRQNSSGIYDAINIGLVYAKGKYINILNSGDFHDNRIFEIINFELDYKIISISTRMIKNNLV